MNDALRGPKGTELEGVTVQFWTVTPEWAYTVLEHRNGKNRPIRRHKVDQLVDALKRGEYRFNSSGIAFDSGGELLDGQHRLTAVVESGVSIPVLVVSGLTPETQDVMDTGAARILSDQLHIRGGNRIRTTASVVTLAWRWEQAEWDRPVGKYPTNAQALAYLEGNRGLREAVAAAHRVTDGLPFNLAPSRLGAAMYRARMLDPEGCREFFEEQFATGTELEAGDPAFVLRERLTNLSDQGRRASSRSKAEFTLALIVLAWNAYQRGQKIKVLRWRQGVERFPRMLGPDDAG